MPNFATRQCKFTFDILEFEMVYFTLGLLYLLIGMAYLVLGIYGMECFVTDMFGIYVGFVGPVGEKYSFVCVLSFGKTLNSLNGDEGRKTVQHPKFQLNFAKLYPFLSHTNSIREGFKKREEVWSFAIPGGGGVSEG